MKSKFEWKVPHLEIKKGEWYVCTNSWSDDGWTKFAEGDVVQAVEDYCFIDCYNIKHYFRKDGVCYFRPADDDEIPKTKSEEELENEKNLLIKDLCARLPYGVKAFEDREEPPFTISSYDNYNFMDDDGWDHKVGTFKPYLRPMSSMTEEEKQEVFSCIDAVTNENYGDSYSPSAWNAMDYFVSYCNSHHLDHRGLIPMGLALEAPEGMYKE